MNSWREWTAGWPMRFALGAAVAGLVLCVWTTASALQVRDVVTEASTVRVVPGALDAPATGSAVDVSRAVSIDLFSPERTPAASRYRMPGEPEAAAPAAEPPKPVVLGTAIAGDGTSFATCQFESARLLMVRVGDKVGDYTVKSIERGRVVFATAAGKTFEVLAPRAGS